MKIVALQAENIKKLVAVEIHPDGNLVQITGANGNGKTSILDAISWALEGQSVIQGEPIRKGEKKAWVSLDLGEMIVKRTFRKGADGETTSSITVESKEGAKFPSPQALIDKLIGRLAFDPLAFARMKAREQFDELKRLVPGVDFAKIEEANKADFEKRTALNRRAKEARAQEEAIKLSIDGPVDQIDEMALITKLEEAGKTNSDIEARKIRREQTAKTVAENRKREIETLHAATAAINKIRAEAEQKEKEIVAACKAERDRLIAEADDLQGKLDAAPPLPAVVDVSALRKEIDDARAANKIRIERRAKVEARDRAEKFEKEAAILTETMEARELDKRQKVEAAKLPVEGMGFGEGIVTMNGVPFNQASDAEQLRASIAIAMSLNPKLRVIRVRDGSLLDDKSLALLGEMAKDKDYQVWIERVDTSGKVGFVVEDGLIKAREVVAA